MLNLPKRRVFKTECPVWKRVMAFIADLFILNIVVVSSFRKVFEKLVPIGLTFSETLDSVIKSVDSTLITFISVVMASLMILYFIVLEYKLGTTIGKMLLGIKFEKKVGFWKVCLSNLTLIPFFPFIILWVIDPIYLLFTPKNQRFMEKISNVRLICEVKQW